MQKYRLLEDGEEAADGGGDEEEEPSDALYSIVLPKVDVEPPLMFQLYATEVRLPTGKYLCEMDGSIFDVSARPSEVVVDTVDVGVETPQEEVSSPEVPLFSRASSFLKILASDITFGLPISPSVIAKIEAERKIRSSLLQVEPEEEKKEEINPLLDAFPSGALYKDFSVPDHPLPVAATGLDPGPSAGHAAGAEFGAGVSKEALASSSFVSVSVSALRVLR